MYDPDYGHLSLGKFMALKEIQWVLQVPRKRSPVVLRFG